MKEMEKNDGKANGLSEKEMDAIIDWCAKKVKEFPWEEYDKVPIKKAAPHEYSPRSAAGMQLSFLLFAFRYSTSGSAASTRELVVIVSVAVMPTLASLMPVAAQIPLAGSTVGLAVYRMGCSGRSISAWEITLLYFFG